MTQLSEADFQLLIQQQLVSSDSTLESQIATVLKEIWLSNKRDSFVKALLAFSGKKEQEIEKLCHANYQVKL